MGVEEMIAEVRQSVFRLRVATGEGTGFAISHLGHILTCNHVVREEPVEVQAETGDRWTVPVLARDPVTDLAMLHVEALPAEPLEWADPLSVVEGLSVFALGHPHGLSLSVSRGVVSNASATMGAVGYVQTDVALNPGNSGGPIVTESGHVVGVADWGIKESHGLGFAIAVRHALAFAAQLRIPIRRATRFKIVDDDPAPEPPAEAAAEAGDNSG